MALTSSSCCAAYARYGIVGFAVLAICASLATAAPPSPEPSTLTISFAPLPTVVQKQDWPTDGASAGGDDASEWTSSTSSDDASEWTGSGGDDASQWSGAGRSSSDWSGSSSGDWSGAGGDWDPSQFASLFTIDLEAMRIAHAILASAAMLIFFPFGGVIVRLISPERHRHIFWFHAGVQMFGYCIFLGAAGVGVWMGVNFEVIGGYHPVIGMIILVGMSTLPITQILNHFLYARYHSARYLGWIHLWLGRILITLGMINGGLGFAFADTIPYQPVWSIAPKIVYAIIAGIVWITYFMFCGVWQQMKYMRKMSQGDAGSVEDEEEMENLRGRAEGLRVASVEEGRNGSRLDVSGGEGAEGRRKVSLKPTDAGFRSSAL